MALDVFFRNDVAQGITAVAVAMLSAAAAHGGGNVEYCRGVIDTVRAQSTSFGIPWTDVSGQLSQALIDAGRADLLESVARALPQG
jgi:hypothetical protein